MTHHTNRPLGARHTAERTADYGVTVRQVFRTHGRQYAERPRGYHGRHHLKAGV